MKVTSIELGLKRTSSVYGDRYDDCCLYLFKTSVIFNFGGTETACTGSSVIMYTGGKRQYFRPQDGKTLKYDKVLFRPSSADKQYISSMNIPFDSPVEIMDDFVISSALKSMKVRFGINGRRNAEFMELEMRIAFICMGDMCSTDAGLLPVRDIPQYTRLKALRGEIYSDPMREWSADSICADLGVSRTYFHRLYLTAFGVTCRQDVIESRLIYAEELLADTDMSVSEIAESCGYVSDSYFMRQFKQHRGCTPTQCRRRAGAAAEDEE